MDITDKYDVILLDAPCSATGTFRRNPDVLHVKSDQTVDDLAALQQAMLQHAARLLNAGGTLVYAVCSLLFEEGEGQIETFLNSQQTVKRQPVTTDELSFLPNAITQTGDVRILPWYKADIGGMDGFFIARMQVI